MQKSRAGPIQSLGDNMGMFRGRGLLSMTRPGSPALHLGICTKVKRRPVVRISQPRWLMRRMSPAPVRDL